MLAITPMWWIMWGVFLASATMPATMRAGIGLIVLAASPSRTSLTILRNAGIVSLGSRGIMIPFAASYSRASCSRNRRICGSWLT